MSSSSELTEGDLEGGLIRRLNRPHTLRGLTYGRAPWAAAGWTAPVPVADTPGPETLRVGAACTRLGLEAAAADTPARLVEEGILEHPVAGLWGTASVDRRKALDSMSAADTTSSRSSRQTCVGARRRNSPLKREEETGDKDRHHSRHLPRIVSYPSHAASSPGGRQATLDLPPSRSTSGASYTH